MRIARNDQVLAAALALLLSSTAVVTAQVSSDPVTGMVSSAVASAEKDLNSRIPLPAPLDVPPPSASDVTPPTLERKAPLEKVEAPATTQSVPSAQAVQPPMAPPAQTVQAPVAPAAPAVTTAPQTMPAETVAAPATTYDAAADPVAIKLKEIVTTKLSRFVDRKDDRPGVESFYAARQYAPLFVDNNAINQRARAVGSYLGGVSAEGLEPADYPVPSFKDSDPQALAEAELKLVDSVITFARHASNGRTHFSRVAGDILYNLVPPDNAQVLGNIAQASDIAKALESYTPQHAQYKALKAKLAEVRGQTAEPAPVAATPPAPTVRVPEGRILRPGDDHERVTILRKRLQVGDPNSTYFDKDLMDAVKAFQDQAGIDVDGSVGRDTVRAMNSGVSASPSAGKQRGKNETINTILANMERWRWMPRDLGKAHVVLNIPAYSLKVINNGKKIWETRVVVGKPNTATPLLTETMKHITVNPTWNVPPSIVYGEYLPALQQDPSAIARMGLKVVHNNDGTLHMYQPPGDGNALGRIRFNFPNKFLVYQHDTPDKHLFSRDTRAYSHGCMRVQDPLKYGEVLLSIARPNDNYTAEKLRSMYGPAERDIKFPTPIPVHITYQTAYVDESGKLVLRNDIYGKDAKTLAVLKGDDPRIADIPMDRREEQQASYQRPSVSLPYGVATEGSGSSRYSYRSEGGNFFEMLFGGPRYYQQQPQRPSAQVDRRRYNTRPLN